MNTLRPKVNKLIEQIYASAYNIPIWERVSRDTFILTCSNDMLMQVVFNFYYGLEKTEETVTHPIFINLTSLLDYYANTHTT